MHYRSIADLNACIVRNVHRLPDDLDLVVGIPRSGLLAASIVALQLNLPLSDFDGFLEGRLLGKGKRTLKNKARFSFGDIRKVLIVDDSVLSGGAITEARERIERWKAETGAAVETPFLAPIVAPNKKHLVDFWFDACTYPRIFEWNLMHHPILKDACFDIDGVLCRDPLDDENDDGERYLHFLQTVEPFCLPSVKVKAVVSARLEKYRDVTEAWLERAGVQYEQLCLLDSTPEERRQQGLHSRHKADVCLRLKPSLFIESDPVQANEIAQLSGCPVFCFETRTMAPVPLIRGTQNHVYNLARRMRRKLPPAVTRFLEPQRPA